MLPLCEDISKDQLCTGNPVSLWIAVADSGPGMNTVEQGQQPPFGVHIGSISNDVWFD